MAAILNKYIDNNKSSISQGRKIFKIIDYRGLIRPPAVIALIYRLSIHSAFQ